MREQMTVHDVCEGLRANGLSLSEASMSRLILEGKVPFGVGTVSEKGRFSGLIFRAAFYDWLDKMLGRKAIRAYEESEKGENL